MTTIDIPLTTEIDNAGIFTQSIKQYNIAQDGNVWLGLNPTSSQSSYLQEIRGWTNNEDVTTTSVVVNEQTRLYWKELFLARCDFDYVNELYSVLSESEKIGNNLNTFNDVTSTLNLREKNYALATTPLIIPGALSTEGSI